MVERVFPYRNPYISLMIYKDSEAFFLIASEENEVSWDGADYGVLALKS
jgi:hypothetical protein